MGMVRCCFSVCLLKLLRQLLSLTLLSASAIATPSLAQVSPLPAYAGPRQITQASVGESDSIWAWRLGEEGEIQTFCNDFTATSSGTFFFIPGVYECYFPILPDDKFLITKDKLNQNIHMFLNRGQTVCWSTDFRYEFERWL